MLRKRDFTRSFSTRLIVSFVAVIVATTIAVGLPAYLFFRIELDRQTWERVTNGEKVTRSLLEAEEYRLVGLATLAAQRPTLQTLVQTGNTSALINYIRIFRTSASLDMIVLHTASGLILAEDSSELSLPVIPLSEDVAFQVLTGTESQLALLASKAMQTDTQEQVFLTVGIMIDNELAHRLVLETGFDQSVLVDGERIVTSMTGAPPTSDQAVLTRVMDTGKVETATLVFSESHYYVALSPIFNEDGEAIAVWETALLVNELVATNRRALLILVCGTFLVALVASGLAALYARNLTTPVIRLTRAALNISQGDMQTPIPIPQEPSEIATLAAAFEESRVKTRRLLDDLSKAKLWSETLIQSVIEGIVTVDGDGVITSFSQGAERITGWKSENALGLPVNQVFHLLEGGDDFMSHVPPSGVMPPIGILTREGNEITLAMTSAQLHPPDREAVQTVLVFRDITEKEAARRLRSYFLANISHEFRTPLSALKASVEWLLEEIDNLSLSETTELLRSVHLSVASLQTLIDNLLESASIEAGRFRIRRRPTTMNEVVSEAERVMKPLLERRQQDLLISMPAQLSSLNVDPTRLTQVLVNLLSNASKYSPMESPIELSVKTEGKKHIRIEVLDRGSGIATGDQADLFRRFVRLGEKDNTQYGVGLGLSVVKTVIEEHGGEVGVRERPGGGSVFWVLIPMDEVKHESTSS